MAGSWNHITERETGKLLSNVDAVGMLENGGDWYEFAEEAYGMVWWIATMLSHQAGVQRTPAEIIEHAHEVYQEGLALSPGIAEEGVLEDGEVTDHFMPGEWVIVHTVMMNERLGRVVKRAPRRDALSLDTEEIYIVNLWLSGEKRFVIGTSNFNEAFLRRASSSDLTRYGVSWEVRNSGL